MGIADDTEGFFEICVTSRLPRQKLKPAFTKADGKKGGGWGRRESRMYLTVCKQNENKRIASD